jgi:NDP-sugar pyrophosphorylase family protein
MPNVPDAILLCGGAGLRLRSITGDGPKAMAPIAGRPFLELLLRQLRRNGFRKVILAVGYRRDLVRSAFGERAFDLSLEYSEELSPLGTGGALRNAVDLVESDAALIMNGDSYLDADLRRFEGTHRETKADASMIVVSTDGRDDCGLVSVGPEGNVVRFREKQNLPGPQFVNAGIYMVRRSMLREIPHGRQISLEEELLPEWLWNGKSIRAWVFEGKCIDIGTPERYRFAQDILANVEIEEIAPRSGSQSR